MKWYGADLHIHTVLSPCGDWSMSPKAIIERAKDLGIDIIAITDHHIVENYNAVSYWGEMMNIVVIPGMEIQTKEEAHITALFEDYKSALAFQKDMWQYLPDMKNNEEIFGVQVVVNENEEVERVEDKLLATSVNLGLEEVIAKIRKFNGIVNLAHIDRPVFSVLSNLGFIPEDISYDFLELSYRVDIKKFFESNYHLLKDSFIISSDAHFIEDMKVPKTYIGLEEYSIKEVFYSLREKKVKIPEMEV
ncbi:MAG TPA: PHP domain-containing protein [Dictyoglomaceae bacterium]|nr:PHP domain-containing protein [Dictyoglomaceae bacterium]HOL39522.1 PHP domain-containing protein [Dictyoglomaceae bacterium]HPP16099.1 PHP domain-containing protein [Dictyoglomaceae bacterium]HPU43034.1 PHP domain-containing protein [Dictyoglomaceae bacterium]